MTPWLCLDIATSSIENACDFLDNEDISAPSHYRDPEKIAAYQAEKRASRLERAGLDVDLARITAIGVRLSTGSQEIRLCRTEADEIMAVKWLADVDYLLPGTWREKPRYLTFNGHSFDLLLLQRRARYLGVDFPAINTDRFKSPHIDLLDILSARGVLTRKPLSWYVKRHGWTDLVKPLTGAEEAQVPQTGRWDDLRLSVQHDVEATYRIAKWLQVIPAEDTREAGIF